MPEAHRALVELHDRDVSCGLEGLDSHRLIGHDTSGLQCLTQALAVVESRDQEQELRFERKIGCAGRERTLHTFRQRNQARHQLIVVEPVRDRRQLDERKRVARSLAKDASALPGGQVIAALPEEASRRRWIEWLEPKLGQLDRAEGTRVALASRGQQDDRI